MCAMRKDYNDSRLKSSGASDDSTLLNLWSSSSKSLSISRNSWDSKKERIFVSRGSVLMFKRLMKSVADSGSSREGTILARRDGTANEPKRGGAGQLSRPCQVLGRSLSSDE